MTIRIGIINVSDRASKGIYEDIPGKAIVEVLTEYIKSPWEKEYEVIPDEQDLIEKTLIDMADNREMLPDYHIRWHGTCRKGRYARGHGGRLSQDVARVWRVDACKKSYICTHGHSFATDSRHTQWMFNCKFTREAKIYPTMFRGCLSGDSILH